VRSRMFCGVFQGCSHENGNLAGATDIHALNGVPTVRDRLNAVADSDRTATSTCVVAWMIAVGAMLPMSRAPRVEPAHPPAPPFPTVVMARRSA